MTTTATPAANETKPEPAATPAPAANATPAPAATAAPAPAAADPKSAGTAPAPAATPAPADAGADVEDDGDDTDLLLGGDVDDDGAKSEGDKPADGEKATEAGKAPASDAWAKEIEETADYYIKKFDKKLSVDKDGKPLSARQKQAAIDDAREKITAKLARYKSRAEANLAHLALVDKQSSGKLKAALPENATDEELAAWRKDNDIPEDAKGYKLPKVQGEEWTEADRPGIDMLLGRMHGQNASQAQVDAVLTTYKEMVAKAKEAEAERTGAMDKEAARDRHDALRDHYGDAGYKEAMALLKRAFADREVFSDDTVQAIAQARTNGGKGPLLIANPEFTRFIIESSRSQHGDGGMLTGDQQAQVNTEEQELINLMNTDIDAYNYKPWKTTGMTASERLLEIRRKKESGGRGRQAA